MLLKKFSPSSVEIYGQQEQNIPKKLTNPTIKITGLIFKYLQVIVLIIFICIMIYSCLSLRKRAKIDANI